MAGSVKTDGPEDGAKEGDHGGLTCQHLEDEMDKLTAGDFKWSFIPVSAVNATLEEDE